MADETDVLSSLDPILASASTSGSPWVAPVHAENERVYVPDYDLATRLLAVPIGEGRAEEQKTGRVAKGARCLDCARATTGGVSGGRGVPASAATARSIAGVRTA